MRTNRFHTALLALGLALAGSPPSAAAKDLPAYDVANAAAAPVTAENLLANEQFWPNQVALPEPWQPAGRETPLPARIPGVLIRVEASGAARIDFGRDGLHTVPLEKTDLLSRANALRLGEAEKMAPNLVLDIGTRLLDPTAEALRPLGLLEVGQYRLFACVFADPGAPGFAQLAAQLAPLRGRDDVLSVLFPLGEHPDAGLRERLRALDWPVPFMMDHLAEPYARSLLPEGLAAPTLLLLTHEGRLLLGEPVDANTVGRVEARLPARAAALETK